MILDVAVLGIAVFGVTEMIKLFLPFGVLSQIKGAIVVSLSVLGGVLLASTIREGVLLTTAALGAALIWHALHKALDGSGEINRMTAMLQLAKRMQR